MGFFDRLRSHRADRVEAREALYVHLATDGAIFIVRGTGEQLWTDRGGLWRELERTKERSGTLLYSRDEPGQEPPAHVEETFQEIVEFGLSIRLLDEPHPEAVVPPERRRSVTRDEP